MRLEEIHVWDQLAESLDVMERNIREEVEHYDECLKERFPDGDFDKNCYPYRDREKCKIKLVAYENIRTVIFKLMG